ncbi:hypothetical protein L1049_008061 [Liquidambar formosana]|uniref:Uncharacterized protein n=1 Tax=Liquidambar formosana TaxID=63359 RepID=A0AAP0X8X5_LIQFO
MGLDRRVTFTRGFFPSCDFPHGFGGSFGFSSDLSSPVESVVGSTETESDEEDYLAGLTRQMARSTLDDDSGKPNYGFASENTKAWVMAGSPQSTLCALGSGCGCRQGSSRGSPNGPSQASSPPGTWDLLYAAAGEVARMRMNEEGFGYHHSSRGLLGPPRKPTPVSVNPNSDVGFYPKQSLSHQQLQAAQFQQMKQQQMMKQQSQAVWGGGQLKATGQAPPGSPNEAIALWVCLCLHGLLCNISSNSNRRSSNSKPLQQQQNGSGMRAVFLGTPGSRRECAGTGVFLPRRGGYAAETRKKPACSTVLLPARVVQALNLNLDDMGSAPPQLQPRMNGTFASDSDGALRHRSSGNVLLSQQKRNFRPQPVMNHEIRLPQEWTY